ncbi:lipoate--protein ligase family protein [Planctomicrobium sp. SH527]|uniref:lipoate--protein ligase family protein n=1 Tax=Planctomicrobium sp. SH527 TaxID=3448123 RepID=UPI003F5C3850
MTALNVKRLLIDQPMSGAFNMAVDEHLLNAGLQGTAALRLYEWDAPTVSLGHFQAAQGQFVPPRFADLAVVKRLSGGGAILHHAELTYSCVLPTWHPVTRDPGQLYDLIHEVIIEVLTQHGVTCRMRGDEAFPDQSFLCFSRGDSRDIVMGSHKIVGSAQRRRQGVVLQHGSILLRQSEFAPEFPGVYELSGKDLTASQLIPSLVSGISQRLNLEFVSDLLTNDELQQIASRINVGVQA